LFRESVTSDQGTKNVGREIEECGYVLINYSPQMHLNIFTQRHRAWKFVEMPKAPMVPREKAKSGPLYESIRSDEVVKPKAKRPQRPDHDDDYEETAIPTALSKKILKLAKEQDSGDSDNESEASTPEINPDEVDEDGYMRIGNESEEGEDWAPNVKVTTKASKPTKTDANSGDISAELVDLYTRMGKWMAAYRSGKVLKGLKMIPSLNNWEEVVYLMNPLDWSAAAHYEANRIFVSNLKPQSAQRYLNLVLLPAVREDIAQHKKLNFHYYEALKKALYKPQAFFRGILLPLALEGCSTREAIILGSVVSKMSIPVNHSAAALYRIAGVTPIEWTSPVAVLMSAMISKRYALPNLVVQQVASHFSAFATASEDPPVIWHVGLLSFVQIYGPSLNQDSRDQLLELLKVRGHPQIGIEIRRELDTPMMQL
jgi:essential nuclear protein 1